MHYVYRFDPTFEKKNHEKQLLTFTYALLPLTLKHGKNICLFHSETILSVQIQFW